MEASEVLRCAAALTRVLRHSASRDVFLDVPVQVSADCPRKAEVVRGFLKDVEEETVVLGVLLGFVARVDLVLVIVEAQCPRVEAQRSVGVDEFQHGD